MTDVAQELLAACRELYQILIDGMTADYDAMVDALRRSREAIAKAEQESVRSAAVPLPPTNNHESRSPDGDGQIVNDMRGSPGKLQAEPIAKAGPGCGSVHRERVTTTDGGVKDVSLDRAGSDGPATAGSEPADSQSVPLSREHAALYRVVLKIRAAFQALRTEERAVHGPVIIVHAGRCGRELNILMAALDELAAVPLPREQEKPPIALCRECSMRWKAYQSSEHVATIVYDRNTGEIRTERPQPALPREEPQPFVGDDVADALFQRVAHRYGIDRRDVDWIRLEQYFHQSHPPSPSQPGSPA